MGEANRWQDAFSQALREQAILIAGLMKRVQDVQEKALMQDGVITHLMKRIQEINNENTETGTSGQEVIYGITGAVYVPQVFNGPHGVRHKADIDREQALHAASELHTGGD